MARRASVAIADAIHPGSKRGAQTPQLRLGRGIIDQVV
jgi:hypothetical protein